jgi:hypothetical protein
MMIPIEGVHAPAPRRKRGRPLEMAPDEVLRRIREWGERNELFRVHRDQPAFYARARRLFGSWAGALERAGVDHAAVMDSARRRSRQRPLGSPDGSGA